MSSCDVIDLLSDDEEPTLKQTTPPAQPPVQGVQAVQATDKTSMFTSFAHNTATAQASDRANGRSRCRSLDPSASTRDVLISKRCHSEPSTTHYVNTSPIASDLHVETPTLHAPTSKAEPCTSTGSTRRTASKACYDCRKQKMRCEYTTSSGTSCQRCVRVGRPCVNDYGSVMPAYNPRSGHQKSTIVAPPAGLPSHVNGKTISDLKRKPIYRPEIANKRPRITPVAQMSTVVPNQPAAPSVAPSTCNTVLWSTPSYQGSDKNAIIDPDLGTQVVTSVAPSAAPAPMITSSTPFTNPVTDRPPTESTALTPRTRRTRSRRTMWTCAQLASLATELQASFDFEGFATRTNKSKAQVLECFSYLVTKPTLEYAAEGQKIARNFHRDLKEDRESNEKNLKQWKRREGKEVNEKSSEENRKTQGTTREKKKGVLEMTLTGNVGAGDKAKAAATKVGSSDAELAKKSDGAQRIKSAPQPVLAVPVRIGDKAEMMKERPAGSALAEKQGVEQMSIDGFGKAQGNVSFEDDEMEGEPSKRGPIETALALEREKRQQQMVGVSSTSAAGDKEGQ